MQHFEYNGRTYILEYEHDDCHGAPWEECDGYGIVSDWTKRAKRPGELILTESRGSYRYYDFQQSCQIARRDGWDAKPYNIGQETKRQQAAKAALADYECLRKWCNDEWCYVVLTVRRADSCECCGDSVSLGGVESWQGDDSHMIDCAAELAQELESRYE